jgi:hypothetical protein
MYEQFDKESLSNPEVNYAAKHDVGYLLYNYLKDYNAAAIHYKGLEAHPWLAGNDLQADYRRVELYTRIAESALACKRMDDVRTYAKMVLAYPYLGMEDRKMYREFYRLYQEAANIFLVAYEKDAKELIGQEIYPSHEDLYKARKRLIGEALSPGESLEKAQSKRIKELPGTTSPDMPKEPASQPAIHRAGTSNGKHAGTDGQSGRASGDGSNTWSPLLCLAIGVGAGLIGGVALICIRRSRKR